MFVFDAATIHNGHLTRQVSYCRNSAVIATQTARMDVICIIDVVEPDNLSHRERCLEEVERASAMAVANLTVFSVMLSFVCLFVWMSVVLDTLVCADVINHGFGPIIVADRKPGLQKNYRDGHVLSHGHGHRRHVDTTPTERAVLPPGFTREFRNETKHYTTQRYRYWDHVTAQGMGSEHARYIIYFHDISLSYDTRPEKRPISWKFVLD